MKRQHNESNQIANLQFLVPISQYEMLVNVLQNEANPVLGKKSSNFQMKVRLLVYKKNTMHTYAI